MPEPGRVHLVGAGPGDPRLITLRGLECLRAADVVVYDRLAPAQLVDEGPPGAERLFVGKGPRHQVMSQREINELLVDRARRGLTVVRLKGGDPFVFGRGGEEVAALVEAGIEYEVVPGVTSAIAAAEAAGIPLTHRAASSSFAVVTGHEDDEKAEASVDWGRLAGAVDTIVILMGVSRLDAIARDLISGGRSPDEPVAVVRMATTARQRVVVGALGTIAERLREERVGPPAVVVVGRVVEIGRSLRAASRRPLDGLRVLVTRASGQASELSSRLALAGATPIEIPTIRIEPVGDTSALDEAVDRLGEIDWVVLTSANGVHALLGRVRALGRDARAFGSTRICAIGPGTAGALGTHGLVPDLVPAAHLTTAIAESFAKLDMRGKRVLLARADIAPRGLAEALREQGAKTVEVDAYRTVPNEAGYASLRETLERREADVITFTSASTVRSVWNAIEGRAELLVGVCLAAIGPVTAAELVSLGAEPDVVASEHTIPGLVAAIAEWARTGVVGSRG